MNTYGWFQIHQLGGQCSMCSRTLVEGKMVSCEYGQKSFPNANNCKTFHYEELNKE